MKNVNLLSMTLKNFKGIKDLTIDTQGGDLKVFGDNGTGKTTIFDSFVWLLFSKDSNNRADFSIKTLKDGKEINNLEHSVTALFSIDGRRMELQKVYKEKWTKKRGAPVAEFTGHTTEYLVDSVPAKKKEFDTKVAEIVQEDVFKLLTSPTYFNENLQWQDRRKILLQVCGDVEDAEVIASNDDLADLPEILSGRSIEDHRKMVAAKRTEINKELERIPVRIDEIGRSIPDDIPDIAAIEKQVAGLDAAIEENQAVIGNIRNGSAITERKQALRAVELDLEEIKRRFEAEAVEKANKLTARIQEEKGNIAILERDNEHLEDLIKRDRNDAQEIENDLVKLRASFNEENAKQFSHQEECECPTCGQSLPEGQLAEARKKALESFNLQKAKTLQEINADGKRMAATRDRLQKDAEEHGKQVEATRAKVEEKQKAVMKMEAEISALREEVKYARKDAVYQQKIQEKKSIEGSIAELQENAEQSIADLEEEIRKAKDERSTLNSRIAQHAQVQTLRSRIAELEEKQSELAAEYERLERELFLTEEFIRSKVELLEDRINSKFRFARFKLFDAQINGGLKEVCETTFDGVPYSSGLNNAARINVGIDIINTLTEHYGIRAPIFVDNAEAITRLIETDSQLISLVVSEQDKQLRIEHLTQSIKEAI